MLTPDYVSSFESNQGTGGFSPTHDMSSDDSYAKWKSSVFGSTAKPSGPGFMDSTAATIGDSVAQQQKAGISRSLTGLKEAATAGGSSTGVGDLLGKTLHAGTDVVGGALQAAAAPVGAAISAGSKAIVDSSSDNPTFQKIAQSGVADSLFGGLDKAKAFAAQHPQAAQALADSLELAATLAGGKEAAPVASEGALGLSSDISSAAAGAQDAVTGALEKAKISMDNAALAKEAGALKQSQEAARQAALKDVMPDYDAMTPTAREKLVAQPPIKKADGTLVPRLTSDGKIARPTINETELETKAAQELQNIPGYDPKATYLKKYQLVKSEISSRADQLETDLKGTGVLAPKKEVQATVTKAIKDATDNSLILQKKDPTIANYQRVLSNALGQTDGTLDGVLEARKKLDAAYENSRGSLAFGSDRQVALDEVHRAARDALNQYLIDHAPNVKVKEALEAQWNLYRASDELLPKAAREGGSDFERLMKQFPATTKAVKGVLKTGASAAGIAPLLHLMP